MHRTTALALLIATVVTSAAVFASSARPAIAPVDVIHLRNYHSGLCATATQNVRGDWFQVQDICGFDYQTFQRYYSNVLLAYRFKDLGTGLCVTTGGGIVEDWPVYERPCADDTHPEQWWRNTLKFNGAEEFRNMHTGRCLRVYGAAGSTGTGVNIVQHTCPGDASDHSFFWFLSY